MQPAKIHDDEPTIEALKAITGAAAVRVPVGVGPDGETRHEPGYHRTAPVLMAAPEGKAPVEAHYLSFRDEHGRVHQVPSSRVAEALVPSAIPKGNKGS